MIVAPSSVAELEAAPEFAALSVEYAAESQIEGMPPADPQWETYRGLESMGLLHTFSATVDGKLVGYISLVASVLPRYGVLFAVVESWFVAKAHRKTGAGLKLLMMAETKAREIGSPKFMASAPVGSDAAKVLSRMGYTTTSLVFCKDMGDE